MFKPVELIRGDLRVELEYIGEGFSGDYDPDDSDDCELVRFYCSKRHGGEFEDIPDTSYCTRVPTTTDRETLERMAEVIMAELERAVSGGGNPKKAMEYMSWITADELK